MNGGTNSAAKPAHPENRHVCFRDASLGDWYEPVLISPSTIGEYATAPDCLRRVMDTLKKLESDDYVRYLLAYYDAGLERFGDNWRYADITTVLLAASQMAHPERYLEIGVRQGRSMAMVAGTRPDCEIVGFDLWIEDYAGMANPGPEHVRKEMERLGHRGALTLVSGDSHKELPAYLAKHPDAYFDLITVDGDHSEQGAATDLRDVIPRLKVGGILIFDDIVHPLHTYLSDVWSRVVRSDPRFACWQFDELGYGVALAVRRR